MEWIAALGVLTRLSLGAVAAPRLREGCNSIFQRGAADSSPAGGARPYGPAGEDRYGFHPADFEDPGDRSEDRWHWPRNVVAPPLPLPPRLVALEAEELHYLALVALALPASLTQLKVASLGVDFPEDEALAELDVEDHDPFIPRALRRLHGRMKPGGGLAFSFEDKGHSPGRGDWPKVMALLRPLRLRSLAFSPMCWQDMQLFPLHWLAQQLGGLQDLTLHSNLVAEDFETLARLTALTRLTLGSICGCIPLRDVPSLRLPPALRALRLTQPARAAHLAALTLAQAPRLAALHTPGLYAWQRPAETVVRRPKRPLRAKRSHSMRTDSSDDDAPLVLRHGQAKRDPIKTMGNRRVPETGKRDGEGDGGGGSDGARGEDKADADDASQEGGDSSDSVDAGGHGANDGDEGDIVEVKDVAASSARRLIEAGGAALLAACSALAGRLPLYDTAEAFTIDMQEYDCRSRGGVLPPASWAGGWGPLRPALRQLGLRRLGLRGMSGVGLREELAVTRRGG